MKGIIDQFEEDWVIVEIDGETKDFPRSRFPKEAKVGDVVNISSNRITVLQDETEKLRQEIEQLMEDVWED